VSFQYQPLGGIIVLSSIRPATRWHYCS